MPAMAALRIFESIPSRYRRRESLSHASSLICSYTALRASMASDIATCPSLSSPRVPSAGSPLGPIPGVDDRQRMTQPVCHASVKWKSRTVRRAKRPTIHEILRGSWRRGWDSNPRMEVLQTSPLGQLGTAPNAGQYIQNGRAMSVARRGCELGWSITDLRCRGRGNLCFAEETRRFFRRSWADVKSRSPFEPCHFGQLGNDFKMPMIMIVDLLADGRGVQHEIVCWMIKHAIKT